MILLFDKWGGCPFKKSVVLNFGVLPYFSSIHGHSSPWPIREPHFAHVTRLDQSESRKFYLHKSRVWPILRNIFGDPSRNLREPLGSSSEHRRKPLRNRRFSPGNHRESLGTHSGPFSDCRRQVWWRKRKLNQGSNSEPLACQANAHSTGPPRLTLCKTCKFDYLYYRKVSLDRK